jgi:hypothetical protein
VDEIEGEGVAIALLIGAEDGNCVGKVYRWSQGGLTVMWDITGPQAVVRTEPALSPVELQKIGFDDLRRIAGPGQKQTRR